ncbi:MAG: FecR domain-containing protein [Verrucomicrobia bacterium]|nr:FecR domain-containing protein [Prolixibacteraceae bacterium]
MKTNPNINDDTWALLAKLIYDQHPSPDTLENAANEEELPLDAKQVAEMQQLAKKVDLYFDLKKFPTDSAWEKIQTKIQQQPPSRKTPIRSLITSPFMRIAAALLVASLLTVAGYEIYSNRGAQNPMVELVASNEAVKTYTLPDGTRVSLNSDTHFKYPKTFGKDTREVTIEGEAFFEVMPDPAKPFIIHAGEAQIKVLGTSFNVRAYSHAKLMEVIVKTGKVQVLYQKTANPQTNELILNPGDKGTLVRESNALLKSINEDPNFIAWKTHDLIFKATSLNEVITNLENVYKVSIRLENPELGRQLLTAHFNNYSLEFILEVIETTFGMQTQMVDGQYILKAKS